MARRTYRPHINVEPPGADWAIQGVRYWQCVGYGSTGIGTTPRKAYDNWHQKFIRE
jgi:hypothetical protein